MGKPIEEWFHDATDRILDKLGDREVAQRKHLVMLKTKRCVVATDGCVLFLKREDKPDPDIRDASPRKDIASTIEEPKNWWTISRAFLAWLRSEDSSCKTCDDVGTVTCTKCIGKGSREIECEDCKHSHRCECKCDGGKEECSTCFGVRSGRIEFSDGQIIVLDRNVVWRAMEGCPEEKMMVGWLDPIDKLANKIVFKGDGGRVYAMGLRGEPHKPHAAVGEPYKID